MKIHCQPHVLFAANLMVRQLSRLGITAEIIEHIDPKDETLHLIYDSHILSVLPKNYIVVQTEFCGSHWFNRSYIAKLNNALCVWDYSEVNQDVYKSSVKKTCIVLPGIDPQPLTEKNIQYLFYGWIEGSERRKNILYELKKTRDITVVTNIVGPEMWKILSRTHTVINIHYHDSSPLELYRIHEALSFGCRVWLEDEKGYLFNQQFDNLEQIKEGLKI